MPGTTSHAASGGEPGRLIQLDALRAFAVSAVIIHHNAGFSRKPLLSDIGNAGVAAFFVLSGFLITGILVKARREAEAAGAGLGGVLKVFYIRRSLRIFPVYYFLLALLILGGAQDIRDTFPYHAAYLSNWLTVFRGDYVFPQHFWSLAVEEQFYLSWAPMALFLPRRWLMPLVLSMLAIGPLSRVLFWLASGIKSTAAVPTTSCVDLLAVGCLLALLHERGAAAANLRVQLRRLCLIVAPVLIGVEAYFAARHGGFKTRIFFHTLPYALLAFWFIDRAATVGFRGWAGRLLEWRPLVYFGTISYGAYLYHNLIGLAVGGLEHRLGIDIPFPDEYGLLRTLVCGGLAILCAAASWQLFEKRINDRRRRYPYVKRPAATISGGEVLTGPAA